MHEPISGIPAAELSHDYSNISKRFEEFFSSVADPVCLSRIRIRELSILSQKLFLSSQKYDLDCSSRIPDPGAKKDTGSRIRNTEFFYRAVLPA